MNNIHHSDFIKIIASIYKPSLYLELGLYHGETWNKVSPYCKRMVGVDVVDMNLNGEIYIEDTDTFFTHFKENIDMAFIDADHRFESAKRDFMNCFNLLSPGGIIILHDTDPEKDELFSSGYCGDSYKIVDYLENEFLGINILTLPLTEAGLSIVTKKSDTRTHRRSK